SRVITATTTPGTLRSGRVGTLAGSVDPAGVDIESARPVGEHVLGDRPDERLTRHHHGLESWFHGRPPALPAFGVGGGGGGDVAVVTVGDVGHGPSACADACRASADHLTLGLDTLN